MTVLDRLRFGRGGRRPGFVAGALLVGLVGGVAACSSEIRANALRAGECVEDEASIEDAEVVDCDEPHAFEVVATFDLEEDGAFPGDDEVEDLALEGCTGQRFEDYTGVPYVEFPDLFVTPIEPTEETWDQASDRTVICLAHDAEQTTTTGSIAR